LGPFFRVFYALLGLTRVSAANRRPNDHFFEHGQKMGGVGMDADDEELREEAEEKALL
jgi:hypothetical protein